MNLPATWNLFGDDHLPYQLLLLAKMIDRKSARQLQAEFGLSLAEWRVLAFICSSGSASASEIGTAGEIDRAEISRAVSKLTQAGLIERHPSPENRRRMIISATGVGEERFRKIRDQRQRFFEAMLEPLSSDERAQFAKLLQTTAINVASLS